MIENIVISVVTALIVAPLTVWLSLRRFYVEKWWEKKLDAYLALIESLHHYASPYDMEIESRIQNRELTKDELDSLWGRHRTAEAEILKQMDMSEVLISPDAVKTLQAMFRSMESAKSQGDHLSYIDQSRKSVTRCLEDLKKLAMRDLKTSDGKLRWR